MKRYVIERSLPGVGIETRNIVMLERGRFRVRDRSVLRYYARTIEHLLITPGRTH